MNKPVLLKNIWPIDAPNQYKLHYGRWNRSNNPLDVWVDEKSEWNNWQVNTRNSDMFNRQYIFSMMQFYHETDTWLFGGIFEITGKEWVERKNKQGNDWKGYVNEVELTDVGEEYIGRLKLYTTYRNRATRVNFENHYDELVVREILAEQYSGQTFPGYQNINLSFGELARIVENDRPGWKAALQSVYGVYLITDTKTNKRYVGSAYSDGGVWSRWTQYISSGHGGNKGLKKLLKTKPNNYHHNFRFCLLEFYSPTTEEFIINRENFWKEVLLTREKYGYNEN